MGEWADEAVDNMFDGDWIRFKQPKPPVTIHGHKVHATRDAVLWHKTGDVEPQWIPQKQVISISKDGQTIKITAWMARVKGW